VYQEIVIGPVVSFSLENDGILCNYSNWRIYNHISSGFISSGFKVLALKNALVLVYYIQSQYVHVHQTVTI